MERPPALRELQGLFWRALTEPADPALRAVVVSGGVSWRGRVLLPDVDESVGEVASWITPRLGGVGPTTVAMLLRNTVEIAERAVR